MQHLCSRTGTVAMTVGAAVLLSLPVVALAKGPPDAVGGGTDTARTVVPPQANVPDPPPGQLQNADPAPKPPPPAEANTPGPASTPGPPAQAPPAWAPGSAHAKGTSPKHGGPKGTTPPPSHELPAGPADNPLAGPADTPPASEPGGGDADPGPGGDKSSPSGSPDEPDPTGDLELPRADTPDDDGAVEAAVVSDTVDLPEDASPDTLPFTGLQLALMVLVGLAVVAGGLALRRTATR
jgi:hypothetical protein